MERDFMGLTAKVKQEVPQETADYAIGQNSTMQWTFPNNGSVPHFLSFNSSKNEKPKTGFEALASAGLVSITTSDSVDTTRKSYSSNNLQKQGGNHHYAVNTYQHKPFESNPIHRPVDDRMIRVMAPSSQAMNYPTHNSFISAAGSSLVGSVNPQQPMPTRSVPGNSNSPVVGTTELRNMSKNLDAPAQLTIFYNGSVCVYDDISPEKAQAIMLLAGNKPTIASNPQVPISPIQMPTFRPNNNNNSFVENTNRVPISCFSSPISVISVSSSQSTGGGFVNCDDAAAVRTIVTLKSPCNNKTEIHKNVKSIGFAPPPPPPTVLPPGSAVPQFRKASLARFLVKRKERVLISSPYSDGMKEHKECNMTVGSSSKSISVSSSGSCAVPAAI